MCVFAITKEIPLISAQVECKIHSWDMLSPDISTDVKMYVSKEAFTEENRFSLKYRANEL